MRPRGGWGRARRGFVVTRQSAVEQGHKPTTIRLRDVFKKHDLATEVMPFNRVEYDKEWVWNEWKKYDPFKGEQLEA